MISKLSFYNPNFLIKLESYKVRSIRHSGHLPYTLIIQTMRTIYRPPHSRQTMQLKGLVRLLFLMISKREAHHKPHCHAPLDYVEHLAKWPTVKNTHFCCRSSISLQQGLTGHSATFLQTSCSLKFDSFFVVGQTSELYSSVFLKMHSYLHSLFAIQLSGHRLRCVSNSSNDRESADHTVIREK